MNNWSQHGDLLDIAADLPRFGDDIAAFAQRLGLKTADLRVDHISLRCNETATAERWHRGFLACATLLSENRINGRAICLYKLPQPLKLLGWDIDIIELPWPGARRFAREGWEHIEAVLPGKPQELNARALALFSDEGLAAPDISIKTSQPSGAFERLPNPTLAVTDGAITIKFHPFSIEEIVLSEGQGA